MIHNVESKSRSNQTLSNAGIATSAIKPPRNGTANLSAPRRPLIVTAVRSSSPIEDSLNLASGWFGYLTP